MTSHPRRTTRTSRVLRNFVLLLAALVMFVSSALATKLEAASAQTGSTVPNVEAIVARMAQARAENRARSRPYIVTREYKLYGKERQATKSQVVADVTFVPPDSKKYTIQQINGSGLGKMIIAACWQEKRKSRKITAPPTSRRTIMISASSARKR